MIKIISTVISFIVLIASPLSAQDLTRAQKNAVRSANSYLETSGFSRNGLIFQLSSEYGGGYDVRDATVAVEMSGCSCNSLIKQLSSEYGNEYTQSQARYGAQQAGAC